MSRVLGVAVILAMFNGCASRDAPAKTSTDAAVDSGVTEDSPPEDAKAVDAAED
jgi:hypothetical protein